MEHKKLIRMVLCSQEDKNVQNMLRVSLQGEVLGMKINFKMVIVAFLGLQFLMKLLLPSNTSISIKY